MVSAVVWSYKKIWGLRPSGVQGHSWRHMFALLDYIREQILQLHTWMKNELETDMI